MSTVKPYFSKAAAAGRDWFNKRSARERVLIGAAGACIAVAAIYLGQGPIFAAFEQQQVRLKEAEQQLTALPYVLERYAQLKARHTVLENSFKEVSLREEEAVAHLESLIRNTAGAPDGYAIKDPVTRRLGENYEKTSLRVNNLWITSLPKLVRFFEDLVYGEKPFILELLDIKKSGIGERLDVELDVSSVRRARAGEGGA